MFYILTLLIIVAFLLSMRIKREEFLSVKSTNTIRGLAALCIVAHHISQYIMTQNIWINLWKTSGFLFTGIFLMLSGYGNFLSLKKRGTNVKWIIKRILTLIIPFFLVFVITVVAGIVTPYGKEDVSYIKCLITLTQPGWVSWYIKIQMVLYLLMFVVWMFWKNDKISIAVFSVASMILIVLLNVIKHDAYWYNTILCFTAGIIIASLKEKIQEIRMKESIMLFIMLMVLFVISFGDYLFMWNYKFDIVIALTFSLIVIVVSRIIRIDNTLLNKVGKMSYEIYLSHLIYVRLFLIKRAWNINENISILLILIFTAITAVIIHGLTKRMIKACKV